MVFFFKIYDFRQQFKIVTKSVVVCVGWIAKGFRQQFLMLSEFVFNQISFQITYKQNEFMQLKKIVTYNFFAIQSKLFYKLHHF